MPNTYNGIAGPWEVRDIVVRTAWDSGLGHNLICKAPYYGDHGEMKYWRSTSRLIAAAPDLLDACQSALQYIDGMNDILDDTDGGRAMAADLQVVIEKATGADDDG